MVSAEETTAVPNMMRTGINACSQCAIIAPAEISAHVELDPGAPLENRAASYRTTGTDFRANLPIYLIWGQSGGGMLALDRASQPRFGRYLLLTCEACLLHQ